MALDMEQFLQIFFEESYEGLDIMESGLLNIDFGALDSESINAIFRAAHSIKGGAGTFGLMEVADFTHLMETLLDQLRSGQRQISQDDVDVLLESVDCLRSMLDECKEKAPHDQERIAGLKARFNVLLDGESSQEGAPQSESQNAGGEASTPNQAAWKIHFKPHSHLFQTGNDPVRILRELDTLGDMSVHLDSEHVPVLSMLDPEECSMKWDIQLHGEVTKEQIVEVFEWVDGDCDLTIEPLEALTEDELEEPQENTTESQTAEAVEVEKAEEAAVQEAATKVEAAAPPPKKAAAKSGGDTASIRVGIDKVDALINIVGELVITQSMLSEIGSNFDMSRLERLAQGLTQLERNTRELQESVMRIRMLPISFVFQRFPRMVRDLSRKLNKNIELKLSGEQTELDKTVLEKIGDPMVHLVRNALDHGVESPEERVRKGKPEHGTVHLNASHEGGNIVIEISDDGAGLPKDKIFKKALENGLIDEDAVLSDEKIYDLIFQPGFSTAAEVSDVSGRGVGMDVVRRNIKELGGNVEVSSQPEKGSTFTIRLPLTLAILDGQLVEVEKQTYIVPLVSIVESIQIKPQFVNSIAGGAELYKLRDDYIPIVRMSDVFGLSPEDKRIDTSLLVVVEGDNQRVGLLVDDLLSQQQVVIKSLETNFKKVEGISGATILGDGTVALILDINGLIEYSKSKIVKIPPDEIEEKEKGEVEAA